MTDALEYQPLDLSQFADVEWERLAHPQDDQYDTAVFERICAARYGWRLNDLPPGTPTWLSGRVEIRKCDPSPWGEQGYIEVKPGDERWRWAAVLAETWPAQHAQFRRLINYVGSDRPPSGSYGNGCSCGPPGGNPFHMRIPIEGDRWGCIFCTMHSGSGFCEGICHELSHWKGYALGIYIEDWEHLIFANDPPREDWIRTAPPRADVEPVTPGKRSELHQSWVDRELGIQPLRPDALRPLGACFQETWTCVHMIAYHLAMFDKLTDPKGFPGEPEPHTFIAWADSHVARTMHAHRDIVAIAEPTPKIGERFFHGYCSWVDRLVAEAKVAYARRDPY